MVIDRKIRLFVLIVCPALLTGCVATMSSTPAQQRAASESAASSSTHSTNNPVEAAILSQISSMKTGEEGTVGDVTFIAGEAYTAASGRRCRPVTITDGRIRRGQLVCENGRGWFFSKRVFVTRESK